MIKRFVDIVVSIVSMILLLPLFLIIGFAIKIDSKGPVFFKQERLGKNGKVFKIIKFRTMVDNAEQKGSGLSTFEGDPRVTSVGEILRKTSLDEISQLINILIGDMSLVGPRPPVPFHPRRYEEYSDHQVLRFKVRPGITGLAQIMGRNSLTWDERIKYDVEYVQNLSLLLDIKIIFLTIVKVFKSENIHGPSRRKRK